MYHLWIHPKMKTTLIYVLEVFIERLNLILLSFYLYKSEKDTNYWSSPVDQWLIDLDLKFKSI